jgi:hypothetical protein
MSASQPDVWGGTTHGPERGVTAVGVVASVGAVEVVEAVEVIGQ